MLEHGFPWQKHYACVLFLSFSHRFWKFPGRKCDPTSLRSLESALEWVITFNI